MYVYVENKACLYLAEKIFNILSLNPRVTNVDLFHILNGLIKQLEICCACVLLYHIGMLGKVHFVQVSAKTIDTLMQ